MCQYSVSKHYFKKRCTYRPYCHCIQAALAFVWTSSLRAIFWGRLRRCGREVNESGSPHSHSNLGGGSAHYGSRNGLAGVRMQSTLILVNCEISPCEWRRWPRIWHGQRPPCTHDRAFFCVWTTPLPFLHRVSSNSCDQFVRCIGGAADRFPERPQCGRSKTVSNTLN